MTPEKKLAKAYADALNSWPNSWGQYCHPIEGRSDFIMNRLRNLVGDDECQRLISAERRLRNAGWEVTMVDSCEFTKNPDGYKVVRIKLGTGEYTKSQLIQLVYWLNAVLEEMRRCS